MSEHAADIPTTGYQIRQTSDRRKLEIRCWLVLLGLLNLGLLFGNVPAENLMFDSAAIAQGQWWRLLTWPWVHVSRYHLLLDGTAFLLLYDGLREESSGARLSYLAATTAGSLMLPYLITPELKTLGLCGLSGLAHGLFAVSAMERLATAQQKKIGVLLCALLLAKCGWELAFGEAFMQGLHFGEIGTPIVAAHAGGALGGLFSFMIRSYNSKEG